MSTGPTHAMSGLAGWAAVTALVPNHAISGLPPQQWFVGAALASGAALLPDLDHPESTVSNTFGSISMAFSGALNSLSSGIYRITKLPQDSDRDGGHRGFTHTLVFAVLAAVITTAIVQHSQKWALPLLMFFFCGLAVRGIMHDWQPRGDAVLITVVSIGLTLICLKWTPQTDINAAMCGVAVAIGCAAHYLGDAITEHGCPMFWPVPIGWQTWYPVAPPKLLRMRTGGKVEMLLVGPLLTLVALWLSAVVLQRAGLLPFLNGVRLLPPWT